MHPLSTIHLRQHEGGGLIDLIRDFLDDGRINHSTDADPFSDSCIG